MPELRLVMDIGTNSVRLLAARITGGGIKTLEKRLITTRLGKDAGADGTLSAASMARTVAGARELLDYGRGRYPGALPVLAFGTSALREAPNRVEFMDMLYKETGLSVDVVSGEEEARLAFAGAAEGEGRLGVIDIGGGSTELIVGEGRRVAYTQSVPVGAVRLAGRFALAGALSAGETDALCAAVCTALEAYTLTPDEARSAAWVGVGGTITTIGAMEAGLTMYTPEAVQRLRLDAGVVRKWFLRLAAMPPEEKRGLPGLPADRADIITGGACILHLFMERFGVERLRVSDRDNLEGYLLLHDTK